MTEQVKTLTIKSSDNVDISAEVDHMNNVIALRDNNDGVAVISFEEWNCIRSFIDNEVST